MATPRKKRMFAAADDNIMVEAVVQLLKEEVDVDEVFRMVRRSDWNWENESLNRNRNLYKRITKVAQTQGRHTFASSSYKNRFKLMMNRRSRSLIQAMSTTLKDAKTKSSFLELYQKWQDERQKRKKGRGKNKPIVVDKTVNQQVDEKEQEQEPLNDTEKQAVLKTISELLKVNTRQEILDLVKQDRWTDGSSIFSLHKLIAMRSQQTPYNPRRPYQRFWRETVIQLMVSWNGTNSIYGLPIDTSPIFLTQEDMQVMKDFCMEYERSFGREMKVHHTNLNSKTTDTKSSR